MLRNRRHAGWVALFLVVFLTNAAAGQSLAIDRKSGNQRWLDATSPLDLGYRLQASVECQNWADVSDQATGPMSYRIAPAREANRFFRLRPWSTRDAPLILALIGDSTLADFAINNSQFSSWGQGLYGYL